MTRDNLPQPNWDSDGKADNKQQAFINTDTIRFTIQTGDMGPPPPWQGLINFFHDCFLYISYDMSKVNISKMKNNLCLVVASLLPKIIIIVK